MKKIVIAAAAMGGAALVAFGASGTFAAFSDQQQVTAAAGAGTLVLGTSVKQATTAPSNVSLMPGENAAYAYYVQNGGSLPGVLRTTITLTDQENNCLQPEKDAGDTTCNADQGDFSKFAQATAYLVNVSSAAACTPDATSSVFVSGSLRTLINTAIPTPSILGGSGYCVVLKVELPKDDPQINQVQGDTSTFKVNFTLEQGTRPVNAQLPGSIVEDPITPAPPL